jgi:hypothetical protein
VTLRCALALAAGLVAAGLIAGCSNEAKAETAALSAAVARYHLADNQEKPGAAEGIARLGCTVAEVCDAKQACVAASEPMIRALTLKSEVERGLAEVKDKKIAPDDARAIALFGKLDEAKRLMAESQVELERCDTLAAALRRAHP